MLMVLYCMLLHLKMLQRVLALAQDTKYVDGAILHATAFEDATGGILAQN